MADEPRVRELLDEILDSARSPEEVCRTCPELLPEVRKRWQQMRIVEAELEALFPTPGPNPRADAPPLPHPGADLPRIPGYELEAVLGRGGMGVVYRARQLSLKRTVALKMLLAGAYASPHERARFRREAEAVASLHHANIVQVYDVAEHEGRPYFTMEIVEGGSLGQRLAGTPQPARQAAALTTTLADAVEVAHQGGIVHRDLKPANILLQIADRRLQIENPKSAICDLQSAIPKISDFGLARHLEGGAALTQSGAAVGTPSYMAPEQAGGKVHGPAADVYALGAILYELLTGRPPFRAETATETVLQVIYQEPASPSRLNAKVPRDLETICLKCLSKEPERRYASAAALADDLRRFQEGRPIQGRPLGWGWRLWRWGRRRPAAAALVATALALVGLALGGGLWLEREQADRRAETARQEGRTWQAVEAALEHAAGLQQQGRWSEARAALRGAPNLLGTSAPADLRERLRQARADADMVVELEEIRLRLSEGRKAHETVSPEQLYARAFQSYGIAVMMLEPAEAAARVRDSAIHETLVVFLHDWLYWVSEANRAKLQAVVDRADDNQWRRAFREALAVKDPAKLKALAIAPEAATQPPVVLSGLGGILLAGGQREEALGLLREAQQRHPEDFWINYLLGHFWERERPQEAVGYYRVAVVIRPGSDQAYSMLGKALRDTGDVEGACAAFHKALALNPNCPVAADLAKALTPRGRLEEARIVWEKALERDPPDHDAWYGYAQLCLFLGKEDEYRQARTALLERFEDSAKVWWVFAERTSLACLLLPASGDELRRAVAVVDRAVAAGPKSPDPDSAYLQFVMGLAEYRQGRPEQAIPLLREAAVKLPNRAGPRLVLAMAQFQAGSTKEARQMLATTIRAFNWTAPQADHPTLWVSHVLRREAEALILPNLPAFLAGEYQPRDNDERLALLGTCQFQGLDGAAARLYADAFAADPRLAEDSTAECLHRAAREDQPSNRVETLKTECRYLAVRSAALAGCGLGTDGAKLSAAERTRWRKQAREWLRADLAVWAKTVDSGSEVACDLAKLMLTNWQVDPDLAGLRETSALAKLSADEREECLALWTEVVAVLKRAQKSK